MRATQVKWFSVHGSGLKNLDRLLSKDSCVEIGYKTVLPNGFFLIIPILI